MLREALVIQENSAPTGSCQPIVRRGRSRPTLDFSIFYFLASRSQKTSFQAKVTDGVSVLIDVRQGEEEEQRR